MSCLFNSIRHFLRNDLNNYDVRKEICEYMKDNRTVDFGNTTLENWIRYSNESEKIGTTVEEYAEKMCSPSQMGGGIELTIASRLYDLKINVEHNQKIISTFDFSHSPHRLEITLLYSGNHYDPKTDKIIH